MLVAEDLDLGRWLRGRPLIYPILYESLLLTALFICFHVIEHIVIGRFKGEALAASVPHIGGGGLTGLACVAAILFVALIPFFAFNTSVGRLAKVGCVRCCSEPMSVFRQTVSRRRFVFHNQSFLLQSIAVQKNPKPHNASGEGVGKHS